MLPRGGDEILPITTGVCNPKAGEVGAMPTGGRGGWGLGVAHNVAHK